MLQQVSGRRLPAAAAGQPGGRRGLEAICLKAMAMEPEDRYASPRALADDIEHWLADEPVTAFQESIVARLARWTRRHRTLTASCTMLLGATLVALVLNTILVGREQAQTKKALQAVIAAQRERALGPDRCASDRQCRGTPDPDRGVRPLPDLDQPKAPRTLAAGPPTGTG